MSWNCIALALGQGAYSFPPSFLLYQQILQNRKTLLPLSHKNTYQQDIVDAMRSPPSNLYRQCFPTYCPFLFFSLLYPAWTLPPWPVARWTSGPVIMKDWTILMKKGFFWIAEKEELLPFHPYPFPQSSPSIAFLCRILYSKLLGVGTCPIFCCL